jgi:hypothetical protein
MSKAIPDFKRMLLRLPHSREDYAAVGIIAELAGLLSVNLVGMYVEDSSIGDLAELPHAREFRGGRWQPLTAEQLTNDVAFAAREAERLFLEFAGRYGPALSFSLTKGSAANPRETGAEDIIVVIEPINAIERATHQFNEWLEAAFRSASSILLVPSHAKRLSGPIVVIASDADDPCIEAALDVAASTREQMIVIPSRPPSESLSVVLERARTIGVVTSLAEAAFHHGDILLPASVKGRLLIMSRQMAIHRPILRQMPILLVSSKTLGQAT